jgi:hypothetical protein
MRQLKSILGKLPISSGQAQMLQVKSCTQISPYLESCCVRSSANVSYENAALDVEFFTGIRVPAKTQQRLVHRQKFPLPTVTSQVKQLSVDGGKVRQTTALGEACVWRDYKAVRLHGQATGAWFQDNPALIKWINAQPLASPLTGIGDGHDGIWNIIKQLLAPNQRREILDWYHLKQNLYKVGGSYKRLRQAEAFLWQGQVDAALELFCNCSLQRAHNFCKYLNQHRLRIVNYKYGQAESLCSIGSGAVESAVKQIDRRLQISGAQWQQEHIPQVLAHRCAYLNDLLTI